MTTESHLAAPPVLSTPASHVFEEPSPVVGSSRLPNLTDEQLIVRYEIERTVKEIRDGGWRRIALQFPDHMLGDSVQVYRLLKGRLSHRNRPAQESLDTIDAQDALSLDVKRIDIDPESAPTDPEGDELQLSILADTSYGSCCVDEVAAEHVDAQVVVHYGRSCLSLTARLPVIYVWTTTELDVNHAVTSLQHVYTEKSQKIMLMADLPFQLHLPNISKMLEDEGYTSILAPPVIHDPSSLIPNRQLSIELANDPEKLKDFVLWHVGPPPPALLLTLSSRVSSIHIYDSGRALPAVTTPSLRRRYALLTSLNTVSVFGILINTLSVKNYLHMVTHVQKLIAAAGKKSYTFVVGKVNPAKVANFAEIGGWVVIGCWESSLVESREFYKPLVTPFELELALQKDKERMWNGSWRSDFDTVFAEKIEREQHAQSGEDGTDEHSGTTAGGELSDGEESEPPEFDLRTGRYVAHSRPMRSTQGSRASSNTTDVIQAGHSQSLILRGSGELAKVGGVISPGANYLRHGRSWKGLGSDYEIKYDEEPGAQMEEGRTGVARGYRVGDRGNT